MKKLTKILKVMSLLFMGLFGCVVQNFAAEDEKAIGISEKIAHDADGQVKVQMEWLRRPGEFALEIEYFGYLTQEGMVNFFIEINGIKREFVTFKEEMPNRTQKIRILSFHPIINKDGGDQMKQLLNSEQVDYMLFRNAPYYDQFGKVHVEIKFFANGRWDGDSNKSNSNFIFEFDSPIKDFPQDHF